MRRRRSSHASHSAARSPIVWAIATILLTMLIIGALGFSGFGSQTVAGAGSTADFTVSDFTNKPVRLSDYRGQPALVNLWAS